MGHPAVSRQSDLEDLSAQVRALQERVFNLEQRLASAAAQPEAATPVPFSAEPEIDPLAPALEETTRAIPVLGKALLALAGAYLLRAITESGAVPQAAGVAAGLLYAMLWLVLAARTDPEQKFVAAMHGLTSVLVLGPLLWEATVRFTAISAWAAAGVLTFFAVFGLAISWTKNIALVAWITTLGALTATFALLLATHDTVPFTLALLAIAAAVEFSACLDHWLRERWVVAISADLAVLLMIIVATRPNGLPEGYVPFSIGMMLTLASALLGIYLASTIVRTLVRGVTFTTFEISQSILAFLLCLGGTVRVEQSHPAAVSLAAGFGVLCAVACYTVAFAFLERHGRHDRNFYTYSGFALLLLLSGSYMLLTDVFLAALWCTFAIGCILLGGHSGRTTLNWHGAIYLALGSAISGLAGWSASQLLDSGGAWISPALAGWICIAGAIAGYALLLRASMPEDTSWSVRLCTLLLSANAVWAIVGLIAGLLVAAFAPFTGFHPALRTATLTLLTLALAWAGKRYVRQEMVWLVYPLMALAAYKLVLQDFRQGHTLALFASLLLYGGALVLLPRILQKART